MKTKKWLQKMMAIAFVANVLIAMTACNLFKAEAVKALESAPIEKVLNILYSIKLTDAERTSISNAAEAVESFAHEWRFAALRITVDGGDYQKFVDDYRQLMAHHDTVREIVDKHKSEFTPDALAELDKLSAAFNGYASALAEYKSGVDDFERQKRVVVKIGENLPQLLKLLGIVI